MPLQPGPEWRIFWLSPLWVSYHSMMTRFPPFAFVELVSPHNKKNITRWLEDMNFMFLWQEQYLTSERSERVRYCSCHKNIKFISSGHHAISSICEHFKLTQSVGQVATFAKSHVNGLIPFERTIKQIRETMPLELQAYERRFTSAINTPK